MCVKVINEINIGQIIVSLLSVTTILVAVFGWFVNQWLNRRNEKLKKQTEQRIEMLKDFLQFTFDYEKDKNITDSVLFDCLKNIYKKVCLFGYKDEMDLYWDIHVKFAILYNLPKPETESEKDSYESKKDEIDRMLTDISFILRNRIRKELKLEKIE